MKKDERGSVIVEFSLMFPIVILTVIMLLITSNHAYKNMSMSNEAQRIANEIAVQIANPEQDKPYKYIELISSNFIGDKYKEYITQDLINRITDEMDVEVVGIFPYLKVNVSSTIEHSYPLDLSLIGLPSTYETTVDVSALINDQPEFIMMFDLLTDIADDLIDFELKIDTGPLLNIAKLFKDIF